MAVRRGTLILICAALLASFAVLSPATASAERMPISYAKKKLRTYINRSYNVDRGPYIYNCMYLKTTWVRCDVEFKAGLYWRCGRGWVRWKGDYVYTKTRAPIGC